MTHSDTPATDLFGSAPAELPLAPQALLLQGFALPYVPRLLAALQAIEQAAPFRHMRTPGGLEMSVALTNCGALGWTSDSRGLMVPSHFRKRARCCLVHPSSMASNTAGAGSK